MPLILLFSLLAVPYLEFLVFLEVGQAIGGIQALLLTLLTAVLGIYLIRQQGLVVLGRLHNTLQQGENPMADILHGGLLLIAGLFFLLPGFITDSMALLLSLAPVRDMLGHLLLPNIRTVFYKPPPNHDRHQGMTIEGSFRRETDKKTDPPKNIDHKKE